MGLFDLFKKKDKPTTKKTTKNRNFDLNETLSLIEENKYVNDSKTKELFNYAYELTENKIIDRHFLYNQLIDYYYGLRDKETGALDICKKYCIESINHTPKFLSKDKKQHESLYSGEYKDYEYISPRIPAFQRLAIIYDNEGKYKEAIEVCENALSLKLKDGTKSGFEGRIKRLQKKIENN